MSTAIDPAIPSFGTQIQVLTSAPGIAPETYTTIAGVGDIDGPTRSLSEQETTSHSTGEPVRTFVPSLHDPGTLSFPCFFNPSDPTHSRSTPYGLETIYDNRVVTKWRLINTDVGRRTRGFRGFVTEMSESYPVDGICQRDVTIRISGLMTDLTAETVLTPTSASPLAAGGPATVAVASTSETGWFPLSDVPWITIQSPTAAVVGAGSVDYTVEAQQAGAPARTGRITIGNSVFDVSQAAGA